MKIVSVVLIHVKGDSIALFKRYRAVEREVMHVFQLQHTCTVNSNCVYILFSVHVTMAPTASIIHMDMYLDQCSLSQYH